MLFFFRISCKCIGNCRAKSKILISAFDEPTSEDMSTMNNNDIQLSAPATDSHSLGASFRMDGSQSSGNADQKASSDVENIVLDVAKAEGCISTQVVGEIGESTVELSEHCATLPCECVNSFIDKEPTDCISTALVVYDSSQNQNSNANLDGW